MDSQRRKTLKTMGVLGLLAGAGFITTEQAFALYDKDAFATTSIADAMKALGASGAKETNKVRLNASDIAENGAVVPVGVTSDLPNTTSIAILVEKNPFMLAAEFSIPPGTNADIATRIKMGQTSNVYGLVKADGGFYFTKKEIKVTLGGCGG